jgi:hypothetical protein
MNDPVAQYARLGFVSLFTMINPPGVGPGFHPASL